MEFFKKKEAASPDDAQVSKEELEAMGIRGVSMTRGELDRHLETSRRKSAYGETLGKEKPDEIQEVGQNAPESEK